jgi:hypothetical protein
VGVVLGEGRIVTDLVHIGRREGVLVDRGVHGGVCAPVGVVVEVEAGVTNGRKDPGTITRIDQYLPIGVQVLGGAKVRILLGRASDPIALRRKGDLLHAAESKMWDIDFGT